MTADRPPARSMERVRDNSREKLKSSARSIMGFHRHSGQAISDERAEGSFSQVSGCNLSAGCIAFPNSQECTAVI